MPPWLSFKTKKRDSITPSKTNLKPVLSFAAGKLNPSAPGGASIKESHIFVRDGELFLLNANITPLKTASTHEKADPTRTRKLLMHKHEIMRLIGRVEQAGYTLIPLDMHFKDGRVKLEIGLGKGKKLYEKRQDASKKEWKRQQERLLKTRNR